MNSKKFILTTLILITVIVYLFVTAPPPLVENINHGPQIPVEKMFEILQAENSRVRSLWTKEFVVAGKTSGLQFDEHWRDEKVDAGPLPALLLRETAKTLTQSGLPLNLFLGSDFPISPSNKFIGEQLKQFEVIRHKAKPQFFYAADTQSHIGMFPDIAMNQGCVDCHNKHPDSQKKDWKLNDIMGAATWLYPRATVSPDEMMQNILALRNGFRTAYVDYLKKVSTFKNKPKIGDRWPRDGYFLPSEEVFMSEVEKLNSTNTLVQLLSTVKVYTPDVSMD